MNKANLSSDSTELLRHLLGAKLVKVRRNLYLPDIQRLDAVVADEDSDGSIEISTERGFVLTISSDTENMSVEVTAGAMPVKGPSFVLTDVSSNKFWTDRIGKTIKSIDLLKSAYGFQDGPAFGVEISLLDEQGFVVEYISDDEYLDQIRVTGPYIGHICLRQAVVDRVMPGTT